MTHNATYQHLFLKGALFAILLLVGCDKYKTFSVKTETVRVNSPDQIVLIKDSLVKPFLYTHVRGFEKLSVVKAKAKFISAVLPSILVAKHQIAQEKMRIRKLENKKSWDAADSAFYNIIKSKYKAKDVDDLFLRIETLPTSIVLAQAAVESGWGKSRFFLSANNLFGVWSFDDHDLRIAARKTRENRTIYLKSYGDMSQSIVDYFEILARSRAYRNLRNTQRETTDPFKLLPHLKNFSERKTAYTRQLKTIILRNDLTKYDHYQIDPEYLSED